MALNVFQVKPTHDHASVELRGDMSVSFNEAVSNEFTIRFFTITDEWFTFDSNAFNFIDSDGNPVNGLLFGGRANMFIDLMFDPERALWLITATNMVSGEASSGGGGGGGGAGLDTTEYPLTFAALPAMTPINYANGRYYRGRISANAKLANPTNMKPGDTMIIVIEQDMTGGRTLAYDGAYGFKDADYPKLSLAGQAVDTLTCYMTGDYTLQCDLRLNYSVVRPIAYGVAFSYTMQAAVTAAEASATDEQTVQVLRSGYRAECIATFGWNSPGKKRIRLRGIIDSKGQYPLLKLDKGNDRPAFGKALINIEGGAQVVVENLRITGTVAADVAGNGTGVLVNGGVDHVRMENLEIYDNENGIRSAVSEHPIIDVNNCLIHNNGWSTKPGYNGQTHNSYIGDSQLCRISNTTFMDSHTGHNIKSRALKTVIRNVYTRRSAQSREMDIPDQGIVHVYDSVFWKEASAANNNLIAIGWELLGGANRVQEYFFYNCYFHNDITPGRNVTFLENRKQGGQNTVAVHFVDCLFGGLGVDRTGALVDILYGPYTITTTGGPLGPRGPVGSPSRRWDGTMAANKTTNPLGIPTTPFSELPIPMVIPEMPAYPTYPEPPPVPPLPSNSAGGTKPPDTTVPNVSLVANQTSFTGPGMLALTADATDNEAVAKVEFYGDDVLMSTDTTAPYTASVPFTWQQNGTHVYYAIAYDAIGNKKTSASVTVNVQIQAPHLKPEDRFNQELQAAYDDKITNAVTGSKRLGVAQVIVDALSPTEASFPSLRIYRDGAMIAEQVYGEKAYIIDDGYDVVVMVPELVASSTVNSAGTFATGDWWYELVGGGVGNKTVITGTVGGVGSGAEIIFDEDIDPARDLDIELQLVMPRALDELA